MKQNKGFTLVELSIVLIIIGLLVGGILVGQSLITSVKTSGVVRDITSYEVMIAQFKNKYKFLPGDSNFFGGSGDRNGFINSYFPATEAGYVWNDLSAGMGLKNASGSNYQIFNAGTNINPSGTYSPLFEIEQRKDSNQAVVLLLDNRTNYGYNEGSTLVWTYTIATNGQLGNGQTWEPLTPKSTQAIDAKLDDGLPSSGKMTAYEAYTAPGPTSCALATNVYNTGIDTYKCSITLEAFIATTKP